MDHILVVDDEEFVRDAIKDGMKHYGYNVTVASNGAEGLKDFDSHRFKLVITDIKMPIMDGIEFARTIRKSNRSDTPVIAITGYPGDIDIERDLFNSIIEKPFKLGFLAKIISQHLEY